MKRICFWLFACMLLIHATAYAQNDTRWQQASSPQWQGKQDTIVYWYAIDAEGRLALTTDNQKWVVASQPQWNDYEGKMYRIDGTNLQVSSDTGKTWVNATNRFWRGSDGMWYGFDDSWTLWTGGSGNHPPMGIIGVTSPNAGTDAYTGVNANGETTGTNSNNTGNPTNIVTPNATNNKSQGTKSAAEFNNTRNSNVNTNTVTPK